MSAPVQVPFFPFPTLESLLHGTGGLSMTPPAWPLAMFCTWALQVPELSEAPVRQVQCNRERVHEFILLSCDINTATQTITLWLRIERRPGSQGVGVLLNKPKPAVDTVQASTNLQALREPCEPRDSFSYNPNDLPREMLRLKHVVEMCKYFMGHSDKYSLLGANCRWICYALLECLRGCQPCYGGTWFPSRTERPTADVRAAQLAKSHYLQDKHPTCCGSQYLSYPSFGADVARASLGLASVAMASSGRNTRNVGPQHSGDQSVIYHTPRPLSESLVPRHEPSTLTTNTVGNPGTTGASRPFTNEGQSNGATNVTRPPLGASASQPSRQQNNVSPLPAGGNATQYSQSPSGSLSEGMVGGSQPRQRTTTSPVQRPESQSDGEVSHCSGCQCADHSNRSSQAGHAGHHQHASNDFRPGRGPLQTSPTDTRVDNSFDLESRFSSMDIRSNASIPVVDRGQVAREDIPVSREPNRVPTANQCSCCGSQENAYTQPPAPIAPPISHPARNSFDHGYTTQPERIHPGPSQRSATSTPSAGSAQRHSTGPAVPQHSSCRGRCSSHTSPRSNLPPHVPHTQRTSGSSSGFGAPHQRLSHVSYSGSISSMTGAPVGSNVHHNGASSSGADCQDCNPQPPVQMQGFHHHAHNRPPLEQFPSSSYSASHDCSSPYVNTAPLPHQTHGVAPTPPTRHAPRGSSQGYNSNQPRSGTADAYFATGNYTYNSSTPLPRNPVNRNSLQQFQGFPPNTHAPPSPLRQSGNIFDGHYPAQAADLYSIPEDVSQSEFDNRWDGRMGTDLGYGVQPVFSNRTQPFSSLNPPVRANHDYVHSQHPEATLQQPYGLPQDSYPQPNRQWTQEVWGNQEFELPVRTDSPTQMELPFNDGAFSMLQEPNVFAMPDHRNYVETQGFTGI